MKNIITIALVLIGITGYSQKFTINSFGTQLNKNLVPSVEVRGKLNVKDTIDVTGATLLGFPTGTGGVTSYNSLTDKPTIPVLSGATGVGTAGMVQKHTATATLSNSIIYDDGTRLGIGTVSPASAFGMTVESNGAYFRDAGSNNGFYIYNKEPGFSGTLLQAVNYNSSTTDHAYLNGYGGWVRIGGSAVPDAALAVTGTVSATTRATQPNELVRFDQFQEAAAPFILRNALGTTGIKPIYNPNTNTAILKNLVFPGGTITEPNDSTVVININKAGDTGTLGFTANGTTTSFTFVTTNMPAYTADSRVFLMPTSDIGPVAISRVAKSTESFTVYFTAAPSSGAQTIDYFITP